MPGPPPKPGGRRPSKSGRSLELVAKPTKAPAAPAGMLAKTKRQWATFWAGNGRLEHTQKERHPQTPEKPCNQRVLQGADLGAVGVARGARTGPIQAYRGCRPCPRQPWGGVLGRGGRRRERSRRSIPGIRRVFVVAVPPSVRRCLRVAVGRIFPVLLAAERRQVHIAPRAPERFVATQVEKVGPIDL